VRFLKFCGLAFVVGSGSVPVLMIVLGGIDPYRRWDDPIRFVSALFLLIFVVGCAWLIRLFQPKRPFYWLVMILGALLASPGLCATPVLLLFVDHDPHTYLPYQLGLLGLFLFGWLLYRWAENRLGSPEPDPLIKPDPPNAGPTRPLPGDSDAGASP
jgi:hypothetical protein